LLAWVCALFTISDRAAPLIRRTSVAAVLEFIAASVWLAAVALSPVWFGSNLPIVWGAHALVFGAVLAIYALGEIAGPRTLPVPLRWIWLPLAALGIVLCWAAIQIVPGVPGFLQNPIWTEAAETLGKPVVGAISVHPTGGRMALLWAATAAAVFFLAVQFGRDPVWARMTLYAIALTGGAVAAYGLAIYFEGNQWVLWQPKHAYRNALTATFVNKNNYAAFAGMGLTCAFGLLLARLPHAGPEETRRPRAQLLVHSIGVVILGVVFTVNCAGLILAGSRGGAAVTVLGIVVLLLLWLTRQPAWRRPMFLAFGLSALGIIVFAASSSELLASRLPNFDEDMGTRLAVDARTIAAIKAAPWTGYGLGAFQQAFAAFRDASLSTQGRWEYAHNDWLEALMTLGIPVGLMENGLSSMPRYATRRPGLRDSDADDG
jgi:O-antigen ligase